MLRKFTLTTQADHHAHEEKILLSITAKGSLGLEHDKFSRLKGGEGNIAITPLDFSTDGCYGYPTQMLGGDGHPGVYENIGMKVCGHEVFQDRNETVDRILTCAILMLILQTQTISPI